MVKEVEELMDGARKTEKWAGAAHDYLKKSLDNLNTLTGDLDNKSPLRKANKNFREVRRSLAKMQGPFNDVKKNIPKLKDILPETEKKKLVAAETQLAPNEAELIEEGSYLRGGMKDDFGDFNVQFALLSNLHRKEDRKEEQQRAVETR